MGRAVTARRGHAMSDETRTVTVESLAAALREVDVLEGYPWEDQ